jgi:hypothetical protein
MPGRVHSKSVIFVSTLSKSPSAELSTDTAIIATGGNVILVTPLKSMGLGGHLRPKTLKKKISNMLFAVIDRRQSARRI